MKQDDGTSRVNVVGARGATGFALTVGSEVFEESGRSLVRGTLDYLQGLKVFLLFYSVACLLLLTSLFALSGYRFGFRCLELSALSVFFLLECLSQLLVRYVIFLVLFYVSSLLPKSLYGNLAERVFVECWIDLSREPY